MSNMKDFGDANIVTAQDKFHAEFKRLNAMRLEDERPPTRVEDLYLRQLFDAAYPIHADYMDVLFGETADKAKAFELAEPKVPDTNILDTNIEAIAGMGHSFFLRIVYLENVARRARDDVGYAVSNIKVPTAKILPDLDLLTAHDIFHSLRIESSRAMLAKDDNDYAPTKSLLPKWFHRAQRDGSEAVLETGFVTDLRIKSLVVGVRKIATVDLYNPVTQANRKVEIVMDNDIRDTIAVTDLVGVRGLNHQKDIKNFQFANQIDVLVPQSISGFLRQAEPNYKLGNPIKDDPHGNIIYGRVESWDDRANLLTIKDRNGDLKSVRLSEPFSRYKLDKHDAFLASPIKLDDDGIYTIPPQLVKLAAPHAGRLLIGLQSHVSDIIAGDRSDDKDVHFQPTEPMHP